MENFNPASLISEGEERGVHDYVIGKALDVVEEARQRKITPDEVLKELALDKELERGVRDFVKTLWRPGG